MASPCRHYGPVNRSKPGHDDQSRPGSDFLQLDPADAPPGALSTWLAAELRRAVADGRLPAGTRLPASRALAADLGVSRGVVTEAYQRLAEDGHVAGRGRSGTIVLDAVTSSAVTIGAVMGGPVTGGAVTGGAVTGGAVTGGAVTGGAVTGGAVTGGAVTGGAVTGGAVTG